MTVLGVPDVVVLEVIDVDLEPAVVVEVHVGHEEKVPRATCNHRPLITLRVEFYLEPRSSIARGTNWLFFIMKNIFTLSQDVSDEILEKRFPAVLI